MAFREERVGLLSRERFSPVAVMPAPVAEIRERDNDGRARFELALPGDVIRGWTVDISGQRGFSILADGKNCDGALVFERPGGAWTAVVVELKHGYGVGKAVEQLRAGLSRLCVVLDFLGVRPQRWEAVFAHGKAAQSGRLHRPVGGKARDFGPPAEIAHPALPIDVDLTIVARRIAEGVAGMVARLQLA